MLKQPAVEDLCQLPESKQVVVNDRGNFITGSVMYLRRGLCTKTNENKFLDIEAGRLTLRIVAYKEEEGMEEENWGGGTLYIGT